MPCHVDDVGALLEQGGATTDDEADLHGQERLVVVDQSDRGAGDGRRCRDVEVECGEDGPGGSVGELAACSTRVDRATSASRRRTRAMRPRRWGPMVSSKSRSRWYRVRFGA